MKNIYKFTLFIFVLSIGFTSCQKDDLYRPGGSETELNDGDDGTIPVDPDDLIIDPSDGDGDDEKDKG